ncbi:MAG: STAS domain-containing protein [Thermodesulfobacteriota bacterium]|nr:STAS domain-containing protein [Thermodesulfobacteriota bacterium]
MKKFQVEDIKGTRTIHIPGGPSIHDAGALRDIFVKALDEKTGVQIAFDQAASEDALEIDLAGIQLLIAAHRRFLQEGLEFNIETGISDNIRKTVKDAALDQEGPWNTGGKDG